MNQICKIGTVEAIAFLLIIMVNRIILNTPKIIIQHTGNSAWINVIFISIITIIFVLIIAKLFRKISKF